METYISQQKNQLLDSLENQARFSQLVAVVVGEKGIGKSFLIEQLHQRLEGEFVIARIDASLAMAEDQLEKTISLQLGLNWQESEVHLEQRIKNELQQKVLISIDDAQLLSASCLDFVLQLNQNQLQLQEPVLFILLAGGSSLPGLINETSTFKQHQEMCVVFQIEPIPQHETQAMVIDFCRHQKNWSDETYDDKKLNYFWQLSKGNPAELFYHISRWLEENTETEIVEIREDEKTSYLRSFLYILVVVGLVGTLFFQNNINQWIAGDPQKDLAVVESLPSQDERLSVEEAPRVKNKVEKVNNEEWVANASLHSSTNESANNILKEEVSNQSKPQIETEKIGEKMVEKNQTSAKEITNKNISVKEPPLVKNTKKAAPEKDRSEPPAKINESKIQDSQNTLHLSRDEISLLKQDDRLYVLQWMGLSKAQAAKEYKTNHPLTNKMTIYRRANNGQLLYLVISDQLLSKELADAAKKEYKKRGYSGKPWVKSMAAVKKEITDFRDSGIR